MKPGRSFLLVSAFVVCAAMVAAQTPSQSTQQPTQQPAQQPAPTPATPPQKPLAAQPEQGAPLSQLGLSSDQKKQIHEIRKQAQQQVQAVHNDNSLTQQQQMQQIRQIRRHAEDQQDSVLTPEQRAKYEAWRKSHERHHPKRAAQQPQQPS